MGAACGGGDAGPTGPDGGDGGAGGIASIEVTPGADTLTAVGNTVDFEAVALDADGDTVSGVDVTWSSTATGVATVDDQGTATAKANGTASIEATASGVTGSADLAVIQQVSTVSVSPSSATLSTVGATQDFSASATDENGNAVSDAEFVWQSENHAVATVDSTGTATSQGDGEVTVTATAQDVPGHAVLTVNQAIDHLSFRTEPTSATAGEAIDPAVQVAVLDADGNVVEDAESAVTLSIGTNPGGGTLGGATTVNATNGVATFSNVWIDKAALGYTLEASVSGLSGTATSQSFAISAAEASQLAFTTGPSDATAGQAISPAVEVEVRDEFGNTVPSSVDVGVALASNPGGATLKGTTTVSASGGVATFGDLNVEVADAGYTLGATASGLDGDVSGSFQITPAAASRLAFAAQPSDVDDGQTISPAVEVAVRDDFGNTVTSSSATVTVALDDDPTGGDATLSGTLRVDASSGVATFNDLSLSFPASGYTLSARAGGLSTAFSDPFDVRIVLRQVSAGENTSCGTTPADEPFCWGRNDAGSLGDGTSTDSDTPVAVDVSGLGTPTFAAVSVGDTHACGLTTADEPFCWGDNSGGKLGDGTTTDRKTPVAVDVTGVATSTFADVSAGGTHTCGVTTNDEPYCWGLNDEGQVGDGTTTDRHAPTAVSTTESFVQVSAGCSFTCGVTTNDDGYCWGNNLSGSLGDGTTTDSSTPVAVTTTRSLAQITAGNDHACAATTNDDPLCWGSNVDGQLGDGTTAGSSSPVSVAP